MAGADESLEPKLNNELQRWFSADGPLARAMPGWERRPEQIAMVEAVAETIERGGVLLVEAGTGTGKTLAYLVPAIVAGVRVVVSTGTKTLQHQLLQKDIPLLQRFSPRPFKAVMLKGRGNYLCLLRLAARRSTPSLFDSEEARLRRISDWAAHTDTGDRAELTDLPDNLPLWRDVNSTSDTCIGGSCQHFDSCFVMRARRRAVAADVVVVNHHLYFADLAMRDRWDKGLLAEPELVVFDEAHGLEEVACTFFGASVTAGSSGALRRDVARALKNLDDDGLGGAVGRLEEGANRLFGVFDKYPLGRTRLEPETLPPETEGAWHRYDNTLARVEMTLERLGEKHESLLALAQRARDQRERLARILELDDPRSVYWVDRRRNATGLHTSPIDAAPIFREQVLPSAPATVFTSATLSIGGDFGFFRQRHGVSPDTPTLSLPPSFDYRSQVLLYLPRHIPEPRDPAFIDALSDEVVGLLMATRGRALVLFTSHANLRACLSRTRDRVPFPLLVQGDRPRDVLLAAFREEVSSVLFATASFWEGVDVVGESLSCVIIDKLPFGAPDDPVLEARLESLRERGGNPFRDYQLPAAVVSLRQGVGRLIRSRTDRGVIAILDRRVTTRGYGRTFLSGLPPAERTPEFDRVREWVRQNLS